MKIKVNQTKNLKPKTSLIIYDSIPSQDCLNLNY